jgi:hypothetical protein
MFSPKKIVLKKENAVFVLGRIINLKPWKSSLIPENFSLVILYNFQQKNKALTNIPKNQKSNKLGIHSKVPLDITSEVLPPITTSGN